MKVLDRPSAGGGGSPAAPEDFLAATGIWLPHPDVGDRLNIYGERGPNPILPDDFDNASGGQQASGRGRSWRVPVEAILDVLTCRRLRQRQVTALIVPHRGGV